MEINNLPLELQNKIFYYLEHPVAKIVREHIEITEEAEMNGNFCLPSHVLMNTSFCIGSTGTCDHCNKNGRIMNGYWLIRTGSDVCIKCTHDDKIRKLYYNDFIPDY